MSCVEAITRNRGAVIIGSQRELETGSRHCGVRHRAGRERFAALSGDRLQGDTPDEVDAWFNGWYPDDFALAQLPPLE